MTLTNVKKVLEFYADKYNYAPDISDPWNESDIDKDIGCMARECLHEIDTPQNRYMLFGGSDFYPLGGFDDLQGRFATTDDAIKHAQKTGYGWYHIVDAETLETVF